MKSYHWALLAGVVALGCSGLLFLSWKAGIAQEARDHGAETFVRKELPLLLTNWNWKEMVRVASPELLAESPERETRRWFELYSAKLGRVKSIHASLAEEGSYTDRSGSAALTSVKTDVEFEKDTAEVRLLVAPDGGEWRIRAFRLKSRALAAAR